MNLAKANFEVEIINNQIQVTLYDGNTLELEFSIPNLNNIEFRGKKKVKLFTK